VAEAKLAKRTPEQARAKIDALVARAELRESKEARRAETTQRRKLRARERFTGYRTDLDLLIKRNADVATYPQLARLESAARDLHDEDFDEASRAAVETFRKELGEQRQRFVTSLGPKLKPLDQWFELELDRAYREWSVQDHTVAKGGDLIEISDNELKNLRAEKRKEHDGLEERHTELEDEVYRFKLDELLEGLAREPKRVDDACSAIEPAIAELVAEPHVVASERVEETRGKGREAHTALSAMKKEREALGAKPSTKGERAPSLRRNATILFVLAGVLVVAALALNHRGYAAPLLFAATVAAVFVGLRMRSAADRDDLAAAKRHATWCKAQDDLDVKQLDALRDALEHHLLFSALEVHSRDGLRVSARPLAAMDALAKLRADSVAKDRLTGLRGQQKSFVKIYADAALRAARDRFEAHELADEAPAAAKTARATAA
jgi:hypothetical protein